MEQILLLFIALLIGYNAIKIKISGALLNKSLFSIVILILFVMGYNFGNSATNFYTQIIKIGINVLVFGVGIFLFNVVCVSFLFRKSNQLLKTKSHVKINANFWQYALESGKYIAVISLGIIVGIFLNIKLDFLNQIIMALLFFLLFIVGYQMRLAGLSLKILLFNKLGIKLATAIILSSMIAGIFAAWLLNINLRDGLMLSSGFGWYTLSSILVGNLTNQEFGATIFFIDFTRELLAIILLPSLGRVVPISMVGYCGATAMDFSLPIIKQNLDENCVALAISSGMILSFVVPIFIPLFAN